MNLAELQKQQDEIKANIKKVMYCEALEKKTKEDLIYPRTMEENIYCSSDYAGFTAGDYSFYYGYEELELHPLLQDEPEEDNQNKTWAFVVSKDGKQIFRKGILPDDVQWDCHKGLLVGIGYWIMSKKTK